MTLSKFVYNLPGPILRLATSQDNSNKLPSSVLRQGNCLEDYITAQSPGLCSLLFLIYYRTVNGLSAPCNLIYNPFWMSSRQGPWQGHHTDGWSTINPVPPPNAHYQFCPLFVTNARYTDSGAEYVTDLDSAATFLLGRQVHHSSLIELLLASCSGHVWSLLTHSVTHILSDNKLTTSHRLTAISPLTLLTLNKSRQVGQ